jgi:hypothetical protein
MSPILFGTICAHGWDVPNPPFSHFLRFLIAFGMKAAA